MNDIFKYLKGLGNALLFFIWVFILIWYIKGHFGKKWYWFWLFTLYIVLANLFKHEIRGY
jgi:FtsH-binding integral membrane protein